MAIGPWPGMIWVPSFAMARMRSAAAIMPSSEPPLVDVDEGIHAVEEQVAHVDHVRLLEADDGVAVGVGGRHVEAWISSPFRWKVTRR